KKKKKGPRTFPVFLPAPVIGRLRLSHCLPYYCRRPPFPLLPAAAAGHHTPISTVAAADTPAASSHRPSLSSSATHSHHSQPSLLSHSRCHPSSATAAGHLCHPFHLLFSAAGHHLPLLLNHSRSHTLLGRCSTRALPPSSFAAPSPPAAGRCLLFPCRCCLLLSRCCSPCRTVAALFLPTLLPQPSPLPSLPLLLPLHRLLLPPPATAVPPLHHRRPSLPSPTAAAATHSRNLLLTATCRPPSHSRLQPSVAHTHTVTTYSLPFPLFPAPHLPPLPPVVGRCLPFFPAASSTLLLPPTPSFFPVGAR
ncbi:hypothetical protein BHE74_00057091, partial [Ensete ventricosum]